MSHEDIYHRQEPEIRIDYLDNYDDDDVEDEATSEQLREQYKRVRGLRRHTIGRPDLLIHGGPIPTLASKVRFAHQSSSIEPTLLTNRLTHLQQRKDPETIITTTNIDDDNDDEDDQNNNNNNNECLAQSPSNHFHQNKTYSTSYNGLFQHSHMLNTITDEHDQQQKDNHWLSPPVPNNFRM